MIGEHPIQVIHCPGHSPGSVLFYSEPLGTAIVGDSIFQRGIGRTDLPGGSGKELLHNIRQKIFSLPNDTRLLPGHGPATTVEEEKRENPFLMSGSSIV